MREYSILRYMHIIAALKLTALVQWGSWCCTPCLYGRASQRLDIYPINDTEQIDMCDTNCWLFCLTGTMFLHWVPMMLKRTALREHFNIEGDVCRDGMVSS